MVRKATISLLQISRMCAVARTPHFSTLSKVPWPPFVVSRAHHHHHYVAFSVAGISLIYRGPASKIVPTFPSTSCAGPLASTALTICAVWRRWQVFIYLFRDERTDLRALTMDVTGRNIPASLHRQLGCSWRRSTHMCCRHGGTPRICETRCARRGRPASITSGPDRYHLLRRKLVDPLETYVRSILWLRVCATKSRCRAAPS